MECLNRNLEYVQCIDSFLMFALLNTDNGQISKAFFKNVYVNNSQVTALYFYIYPENCPFIFFLFLCINPYEPSFWEYNYSVWSSLNTQIYSLYPTLRSVNIWKVLIMANAFPIIIYIKILNKSINVSWKYLLERIRSLTSLVQQIFTNLRQAFSKRTHGIGL